jgi:uncharacterized membrane protein
MKNKTTMGVLSYLGPLVVIPFILDKNDPFVKFHMKQGIVLLVIEIVLWLLMRIFWSLIPIAGILQLGVFVLAIIGIINVVQNKEKELPLVGSFAKHVKI